MSNFVASFEWSFGKYQLTGFRMSFNVGPLHHALWKLHVFTSEKSVRDQTTVKFMVKGTRFLENSNFYLKNSL